MSIYETLREMLLNHGITTDYTNQQLDKFILEAKLLVDMPFMNESQMEDYIPNFCGNIYCTNEYPLLDENITISIDKVPITPEYVTHEGIIYFNKEYSGNLKCEYRVGLNEDDITNYLIPIVVCLIEDKEGLNIASVNEGDVSISYNNSTGYTSKTLDNLIQNLRNKYMARVRLI